MTSQPIRVLLIEDNPGDARLLREMLDKPESIKTELTHFGCMNDALNHLATNPANIILLDLGLPDADGLGAVRRVRAIAPHIPLVVLTGLDDEALATQALQEGAQDYLIKGEIETRGLRRAVNYAIERQRMQAEQDIRRLNENLVINNEQLAAANADLETFSYSVAHDLRSPIRQIAGFSKILLEEYGPQLPAEACRYLDRVAEGALQMGNLVDDLLHLAQVGRQALSLQVTPLNSILTAALESLRPECSGRSIEWRIGDLCSVACDRGLMLQVFVNLLSNALKYTRRRDPAVIEVGQMSVNGERVIFVRDNGVGFDMQYAGKLFGVFQRLHLVSEFEGTGIGLATVERIIRKHNGRTWAEALPDRGATFFFTVPGMH
jgi:two-component system sensor histidine kinase/response regulator